LNESDAKRMSFADAIEDALAQAMAADDRIIVFGEEVHTLRRNLYVRFGERRVRPTPISESAFLGAAVGAAMAGLRPIAEIMMVDFLGVAIDALLNQAAKINAFSGGRWNVPMVVRAACGGGYGDGGQHEQSLWGWLAHIPGLSVVVPSTPADAGGLMLTAIEHEGPVVYLEHKLLSDYWLEFLGSGGRTNVTYDVPAESLGAGVPDRWTALPLGKAATRLEGKDITFVSVAVGVHRCLEAAARLREKGISACVIDLRTVSPLDREAVCKAASATGRLVAVDEDYAGFGLSGELAALVMEAGISCKYRRVCTMDTIPFAREMEDEALPNVKRIVEAALQIL
jgi:pyruvate/2-oxoglutarate/acetoin dehydrogenase E1 component